MAPSSTFCAPTAISSSCRSRSTVVGRLDVDRRRADNDIDAHPIRGCTWLAELLSEHNGFRDGLVHLPVACHKVGAHMSLLISSASTPGRASPWTSSIEAPPPVEMKVIWSARSNLFTAATLSPPPMMVSASLLCSHGLGHRPWCLLRRKASRTRPWGRSRTPSWLLRLPRRIALAVSGPISRPIMSVGMASTTAVDRLWHRWQTHRRTPRRPEEAILTPLVLGLLQHLDRRALPNPASISEVPTV